MTLLRTEYPVYVEYWDPDEPHGHLVLIKNGDENMSMQAILSDMEGYAGELAEVFHTCGDQSHNKGRKHSVDVVKRAYEAAIFQLLTVDYEADWLEFQRKVRIHKKWGGQVPELILQPNMEDPSKWEAIIPDSEGNPYIYGVRKNVLEDMMDPREFGAKPNKMGQDGLGGWTGPKRKELRGKN